MIRALAVLLFCTVPLLADEKPQTPMEKLAALKKAFEDADKAYSKSLDALGDTPADAKKAEETWKAFNQAQGERFITVLEIAKADAKSDTALAALEWLLTNPRSYYSPAGIPAMNLAAEHHAVNPKVGKIVAFLSDYTPSTFSPKEYAAAMAVLKKVAEKNPDKAARPSISRSRQ